MKRILLLLKIIQLFILLPFEISKGSKKRTHCFDPYKTRVIF